MGQFGRERVYTGASFFSGRVWMWASLDVGEFKRFCGRIWTWASFCGHVCMWARFFCGRVWT